MNLNVSTQSSQLVILIPQSREKNPATSINFEVNSGARFSLAFTGKPASIINDVAGCFAKPVLSEIEGLLMTSFVSLSKSGCGQTVPFVASPLGEGERIQVRGSDLSVRTACLDTKPSPSPSPLRRERRPMVATMLSSHQKSLSCWESST